jgi:hypothetical protein
MYIFFIAFHVQDAIPSRESSDGYRRGTFAFVDLMGNPIGRAHVILRLSSFGLSLLPHLGLLGANASEHQTHSSGHSASSSVPPRAEAFAMAAPPAAAIPKTEQSQQQHHQPHTALPNAAATLPTLVDTVVLHATSVMRTTHQGDETTVEASGWVDPSEDRPPALFFCRAADGGGADEPVGATLTVPQANALTQVRSVLF